tara:strand:+ start:242 stop:586 length:345 start_codon:yes stop_codon:yes gene_type:complete
MSAIKEIRKKYDCKEKLRDLCKSVAAELESGKVSAYDYLDKVYDIEWITHRDHTYRAAMLLVAGGGPTVWINTMTNTVEGSWWGDTFNYFYTDKIDLDECLREMHKNETAVLTS